MSSLYSGVESLFAGARQARQGRREGEDGKRRRKKETSLMMVGKRRRNECKMNQRMSKNLINQSIKHYTIQNTYLTHGVLGFRV